MLRNHKIKETRSEFAYKPREIMPDSRSSSPGNGGPHRRVVSGSLADRIAKFNNPSAPPPLPKQQVFLAPTQRGMVGNRIPSIDRKTAGILGVAPEKRTVENKGMIGNRISSIGGSYNPLIGQATGSSSGTPTTLEGAPQPSSPTGSASGSVNSSVASQALDSTGSPITSRSSTPPTSPGIAANQAQVQRGSGQVPSTYLVSTLPSLTPNLGTTSPSSTRAEAGDTVSEMSLSTPLTPVVDTVDPLASPVPKYDLVPPNLKLATGQVPNPMVRELSGQSQGAAPSVSSSLATQSVESDEEIQMMADVSGVSTPTGTPRAAQRELGEGSLTGEEDAVERGEDMQLLADKVADLAINEKDEEKTLPSVTPPTPFQEESINIQSTTPTSALIEDDIPAHKPELSSNSYVAPGLPPLLISDDGYRGKNGAGIDALAAAAFKQNLNEYEIPAKEKKQQGGEAGQSMEDIGQPDGIIMPSTKTEYSQLDNLEVKDMDNDEEEIQDSLIRTNEKETPGVSALVAVDDSNNASATQSGQETYTKTFKANETSAEASVDGAAVPAILTNEGKLAKTDKTEDAETAIVTHVGNDESITSSVAETDEEITESNVLYFEKAAQKDNLVATGEDIPKSLSQDKQLPGFSKSSEESKTEARNISAASEPLSSIATTTENLENVETDVDKVTDAPSDNFTGDSILAKQPVDEEKEMEGAESDGKVTDLENANAQDDVSSTLLQETKAVGETYKARQESSIEPSYIVKEPKAEPEVVEKKRLDVEPALLAPAGPGSEPLGDSHKEITPVVADTSSISALLFPVPPTSEPNMVGFISSEAGSMPPATPIDGAILRFFPKVPNEEGIRVEVHVNPSISPVKAKPETGTGLGLKETNKEEVPAADLSGQSAPLEHTYSPDIDQTPTKKHCSTTLSSAIVNAPSASEFNSQLNTTPPGGVGKELSKRSSTWKSPKSPLLDDEDPGDFEPGEGWAVVTKGRDA
ncbi:uncharacterized protein L203_102843 [Cryptococcus depauperatus CBS 7841]|uniref:Uncharacterized protein n=1 Tax=Cryptococcus depauperatus CBS 7841 TaxID=1295531 RepID=A0AAJ8M132_9TREE